MSIPFPSGVKPTDKNLKKYGKIIRRLNKNKPYDFLEPDKKFTQPKRKGWKYWVGLLIHLGITVLIGYLVYYFIISKFIN